jgi:diphosphomevalonate decarboxylase
MINWYSKGLSPSMPVSSATSISNSNIAFIKYWGNRDHDLRLPVTGSISMNLEGLFTRTTVAFDESLNADVVVLGGDAQSVAASARVSQHLDRVRALANIQTSARVDSQNNFPAGTGIASSASAFAALSLAASAAAGLNLSEKDLSILARLGSGSASRSVPAGFVEWHEGINGDTSFSESIAPPSHWALADCIAIVSHAHKVVGSSDGHTLAPTSPLQSARIQDTARRLEACRNALIACDFPAFAEIVEEDSTMMHGIMMTSRPPLYYWQPPTLAVMAEVRKWRAEGLPVCFTIDAGPNVHVLTLAEHKTEVSQRLEAISGVQNVLTALPGGGAILISE